MRSELDEQKLKIYNKNQNLAKLEKINKELESENLALTKRFSSLETDLKNAHAEVSRLRLRVNMRGAPYYTVI